MEPATSQTEDILPARIRARDLPDAIQTHCRLSDSIGKCIKTERKTIEILKKHKKQQETPKAKQEKKIIEF